MLHFNELYITEDGKHLVIDVAIDDLEVYKDCSINKITVNTVENHCNGNSSKAITVFEGGNGVTYVDMDGDGKITDVDRALVDRIHYIMDCVDPDSESLNMYDVNRDGIVDLRDYDALLDKSKGISVDGYHYDVNGDGEIENYGDISAWVDGLISMSNYPSELRNLLDMYDKAYDTKEVVEPSRHIRLCLSKTQLMSLLDGKPFDNKLFVVRVTTNVSGDISAIECLGCGWDTSVLTGVAYNGYPLYSNFINVAGDYGDACDTRGMEALADYALRYFAFDFALRNGDLCRALYYWNELLSGAQTIAQTKGCGCHGTH